MNAIQIQRHGSPDVLKLEDLPMPRAGAGEVPIRVEATAVNYSNAARRNGDVYPFPTPLLHPGRRGCRHRRGPRRGRQGKIVLKPWIEE